MCTGARQRGRNGLRYHSPTGIPSHTAHRIKSRSKQGKQDSQCKLAQSLKTCVTTHQELEGEIHPRGSLRGWQPWSGGIGARALNSITAGPLPATLLGPLCVSSQPLCSSEHPTKTPGPIGLSPPSSEGRSGLVHPGTDDRQAASCTEYYYTSRSYTYEQKQQERALTYMEMRSIMNRNATTSTTTNMRSISGYLEPSVALHTA